ncbi:MAG: hypothetical protein NT010_09685 [Proteobacteria bacterium]|nr:hypothetical protein [Pseudomonadota bacterium]
MLERTTKSASFPRDELLVRDMLFVAEKEKKPVGMDIDSYPDRFYNGDIAGPD